MAKMRTSAGGEGPGDNATAEVAIHKALTLEIERLSELEERLQRMIADLCPRREGDPADPVEHLERVLGARTQTDRAREIVDRELAEMDKKGANCADCCEGTVDILRPCWACGRSVGQKAEARAARGGGEADSYVFQKPRTP